MSQENVEVVRRVSDAYNRRDVGAHARRTLTPRLSGIPGLQLQLAGSHRVSGAPGRPRGESRELRKKLSLKSGQ